MIKLEKGKTLTFGQIEEIYKNTGVDMTALIGDMSNLFYLEDEEEKERATLKIATNHLMKDRKTMPKFLNFVLGLEQEEINNLDIKGAVSKIIEGLVSKDLI